MYGCMCVSVRNQVSAWFVRGIVWVIEINYQLLNLCAHMAWGMHLSKLILLDFTFSHALIDQVVEDCVDGDRIQLQQTRSLDFVYVLAPCF